jgi:hypothetical protein
MIREDIIKGQMYAGIINNEIVSVFVLNIVPVEKKNLIKNM